MSGTRRRPLPGYVWLKLPGKVLHTDERHLEFTDDPPASYAMGSPYRTVFSDVAGNGERMVYVYSADRVKLLEEIGEVAFPVNLRSLGRRGWGRRTLVYVYSGRANCVRGKFGTLALCGEVFLCAGM